jgi:hypothetical protein
MDCGSSEASHDFKNSAPGTPGLFVDLDISTSIIAYRSSRLAACHRDSDGRRLSLVLEVCEVPHPVMTMEIKEGFHDTRDGEWVIFFSVRGRRGVNRGRGKRTGRAECIRSLYNMT